MFTHLALVALLAASVSAAAVKRDYVGMATYYNKNSSDPHWLCGGLYTDDNVKIVALRYPGLINDGNKDQFCGRTINVQWQGKSVDATVVDGCASCTKDSWIDLSPGAISVLDSNYDITGVLDGITWSFVDGNGGGEKTSTSPEWTPSSTYTPPETSTVAPETSTWSPEPSPSSTQTSTSFSSSSLVSSSFSSSMSSTSLNASTTSISTSINSTSILPTTLVNTSSTALTVALPHTTTVIAPDAIVNTDDTSAGGNLAGFNNYVANLGRIVVVGASL